MGQMYCIAYLLRQLRQRTHTFQTTERMDAKPAANGAATQRNESTVPNALNNASYIPPAPPLPPAPAQPRQGIDQIIHPMRMNQMDTPAPMLSRQYYARPPAQQTMQQRPPCPAPQAEEVEIEEDAWMAWKIWKVIETIGVNVMLGFVANAVFRE